MRTRLLLGLLLLFVSAPLIATSDSATVSRVFAHQVGTNSLNVLRLFDNGKYEYCRYTKKKSTRDAGEFVIRNKRLVLKSTLKKHGPNPLLRKKMFITPRGLFETRTQALFGKKSILETSDDPILLEAWPHNPMTGEILDVNGKPSPPTPAVVQPKSLSAQELKLRRAYAQQYYIAMAENYSPFYTDIMRSFYNGPGDYTSYVNGAEVPYDGDTSAAYLNSNFNTVIHESVHRFNTNQYFIDDNIVIAVPEQKVFRSAEFAAIVPAGASDSIFRYNTYVSEGSIVSANVSGIYGLMDEFSAYHSGTKASFLVAQKALSEKDTSKAYNFLHQARATQNAYYEFRLFMAWYLHYAESNHPETYKALMADKNLRVAFTLLDASFKETIAKTDLLEAKIKRKSIYSYDSNDHVKAYCQKQLLTEEKWLTKFKVKDCTRANYQKHLK